MVQCIRTHNGLTGTQLEVLGSQYVPGPPCSPRAPKSYIILLENLSRLVSFFTILSAPGLSSTAVRKSGPWPSCMKRQGWCVSAGSQQPPGNLVEKALFVRDLFPVPSLQYLHCSCSGAGAFHSICTTANNQGSQVSRT